MKTILIPTDFSDNSWNAIAYAVTLFNDVACNFYLLHIGNLSDSDVQSNSFSISNEIQGDSTKKKLDMLFEQIQGLSFPKKHHFIALQEYGSLIDIMRRTIDTKKIDLIVMGTKGASGVKASIIGSNTGDVITKVACNVLVIPENALNKMPQRISFPTDYNIFYSFKILEVLSELLHISKAELDVLHVSYSGSQLTPFQKKNKKYLEDYLAEIFYRTHRFNRIADKNIKNAIQNFVADQHVDMIVMVAKNLNFLQQLLFDTTIEKMSFHTNIPLLVLHE